MIRNMFLTSNTIFSIVMFDASSFIHIPVWYSFWLHFISPVGSYSLDCTAYEKNMIPVTGG